MKRTLFIKRTALALVAALILGVATPTTSAFLPVSENIAVSEAASKTITVKKADDKTAKAVNKVLMSGKSVTLKVKGNKSASNKLVKQLRNKMKKTNKTGVIFQYTQKDAAGSYWKYEISTENAKLYMYSVKFTDKLFKNFKNGKCSKLVIPYTKTGLGKSNGINEYMAYYEMYQWYKAEGASGSLWNFIGGKASQVAYGTPLYRELYYTNQTRLSILCYIYEDNMDKNTCASYEKAFKAKNFSDLSDAMKIWVIAKTGYFGCNYSRVAYNVVYSSYDRVVIAEEWWSSSRGRFTVKKMKDSTALKYLYQNKVSGVCEDYANFEVLYFKQLGISAWKNTNYNINHAWSVVKVKNSKNKTLWIPFDYGIGPSSNLSVSEATRNKYLSTESKRYKIYLSGISGAPTKKNFKNSDFN